MILTFKEDFNEFLSKYALWICLGLAVVILLCIFFIFVLPNLKKKDTSKVNLDCNEWINAFGGKENIKEISANGSRLSLTLLDYEKLNDEEIKKLGVTNSIKMSSKVILVIENKAQEIADIIQKSL